MKGARPARILNLLLAGQHLGNRARQLPARVPQVDLEGQHVDVVLVPRKPLERRVRHEAAVPIILAIDFDGGKSWGQCGARHYVRGSMRVDLESK